MGLIGKIQVLVIYATAILLLVQVVRFYIL